jgi:hypothetical protein
METGGQTHAPAVLSQGKYLRTRQTGGLLRPRPGLDSTKKAKIPCPNRDSKPG